MKKILILILTILSFSCVEDDGIGYKGVVEDLVYIPNTNLEARWTRNGYLPPEPDRYRVIVKTDDDAYFGFDISKEKYHRLTVGQTVVFVEKDRGQFILVL